MLTARKPLKLPWRDALLIVVLAPLLIAGCHNAGFLGFDDDVHYKHELMKPSVPLHGVFRVADHTTYFPVTLLSYRLDRWLYEGVLARFFPNGPAPGIRFSSFLFHVFSGLLLWRALLALRQRNSDPPGEKPSRSRRLLALFAAAAWTVHPAACESVCWISERKNVLAALFGFASLWVYFSENSMRLWLRLPLTALLFTLAMLSKPTAAGFLPVYVLYELMRILERRGENISAKTTWKAVLPHVVLYAALTLLVIALARLNISIDKDSSVKHAGGSLFTVALTDVPIVLEYISNALFPFALSTFYHNHIVTSLADAQFWISLGILAALIALSLWVSAQRLRTLFLWGWSLGALGPALNIIPLPYLMQDRYAYFSLPAILLIAAETAAGVVRRVSPASARLAPWAAGGAVAIFAALAFARGSVFRSDLLLFSDAVEKQPRSGYAHMHLALTLAEIADLNEYAEERSPAELLPVRAEALRHIELCRTGADFERMLEPGRVRVLEGVLHERLGHAQEAAAILTEELQKPQKPYNAALACQSLARARLNAGDGAGALVWINKGIAALGPDLPSGELLYIKGLCYENLGQKLQALMTYSDIPQKSLAAARAQRRILAILPPNQ